MNKTNTIAFFVVLATFVLAIGCGAGDAGANGDDGGGNQGDGGDRDGGDAGPAIGITADKLTFIADEGGPNPSARTFDITNAGNGTLRWSASADVPWITVDPAAGETTGEADTVTVDVDMAGLAVGRHAATVTVSDPQAADSPRLVHIALFVMPGPGITPVFVSFVSHNEDDDRYEMYDTQSGYEGMRESILKIMNIVKTHGIPFDYQTDWRFLKAIQDRETTALMANTNNKNILRYLKEDLGVGVEPHSHECATASNTALANNPEYANGCNYADVAYLIESLGVAPDPVVGGFIVNPPSIADWEKFRTPLQGIVHSGYHWQPEVLWGGGSPQHVDDPQFSGLWRPMDHNNFATDDPTQYLPNIGNGGSGALQELIQEIESGVAPPGNIYTKSFMLFELDVYQNETNALAMFENVLQQLQPYVDEGRVIYATLPELLQIWRDVYGSEPNIWDTTQ